MSYRLFKITALTVLALALLAAGSAEAKKARKKTHHTAAKAVSHPRVKIETSMGDMTIELFPEKAPKTVQNFRKLVKESFYDGILFHRVESGFVIQGGDPNTRNGAADTWGTGGPGYQFEDEPVKDEYTKGTLCMANSGPNTNGSQFFVCTADLVGRLPKKYNLFGRVVDGMETVDKINNVDVVVVAGGMHRPVKPVKILKMTELGK